MTNSFGYYAKQFAIILLASLSTAIALDVFLIPFDVVIGGALGLSSILDILLTNGSADRWYLSAGVWQLLVNIPFFIYCFAHFNKHFSLKTLLYVCSLTVLLIVFRLLNVSVWFEQIMTANGQVQDKLICVIIGSALHGISLPLLLSQNASAGGTDIVALIAQRNAKSSSSSVSMRVIQLTNLIVITISAFAFYFATKQVADAVNMLIYSVTALFICEVVQEEIFKGFSSAVELEITTDKPEEMTKAFQSQLKHGVTRVRVVGGYSHQEKSLLLCVVNNNQLVNARKIIYQVDPTAFAYVENVREVIGKGFANKELEMAHGEQKISN